MGEYQRVKSRASETPPQSTLLEPSKTPSSAPLANAPESATESKLSHNFSSIRLSSHHAARKIATPDAPADNAGKGAAQEVKRKEAPGASEEHESAKENSAPTGAPGGLQYNFQRVRVSAAAPPPSVGQNRGEGIVSRSALTEDSAADTAARVRRVPGPAGPTAAPAAPTTAPAAPAHAPAGPTPAQLAEVKSFIAHGIYGPQALVPPTNLGGFDASYNPRSKMLTISVKAGAEFLNGLSMSGATIVANHTDLAQAATDGNALPKASQRRAFVAQFTWRAAQKTHFIQSLQSRVQTAWSGQHSFQCTKPGWNAVTSRVTAKVRVHQGANVAADHLHIKSYKVPDSGQYTVGAFVDGHNDQNAHNNDMTVSSSHVNKTPQSRSLLRRQVTFAKDSATLDATANSTLNLFINDFKTNNVPKSNPVSLVGHASAGGSASHNRTLAQQRLDAVRAYLVANSFNGVSTRVQEHNEGSRGATTDASFQRVDLIVGSGEGQLVAAHEFGHVFGLKDEYAINPGGNITGTGLPTGTVTGHDAMAKAVGAPGSIAENNDNIMSLGNTVRSQHYATFGWALQQVTGVNEWQVS